MLSSDQPPGVGKIKPETIKQSSNQDVAALFSNLKLQHNHYQPFTRRQLPKPVLQPVEIAKVKPAGGLHTQLGIFSPVGGSGKSLIAASLASILCQQGKRVLLVDASPWQSLAFHFGATEIRPGRRTFFAPGKDKAPVHLWSCEESQTTSFNLNELTTETPVDYVLFDLSGLSGERLLTCLRECDSVLVPLLPDPSAERIASLVQSMIDSLGALGPHLQFLLNNTDDSAAACEIHDSLKRSLGEQLFPSVILHQPEVRSALKHGVVLPFYAPEAQASVVLREVARWLLTPARALLQANSRWIER